MKNTIDRLKKLVRKFPRIHNKAVSAHHRVSSLYVRYLIWRYCDLSSGNQEDVEIIEVDPDRVTYINDPGFRPFEYDVCKYIGGSWDRDLPLFNESLVYNSFHEHFVNSTAWEDTKYYEHLINKVDTGQIWHGCETPEEVRRRLSKFDQLHTSIQEYGYKRQRQLQHQDNYPLEPLTDRQPEMHEITVDIGRNGELILEDGRHRLSIAKILNLDNVPVRVLVKHENQRDRISN